MVFFSCGEHNTGRQCYFKQSTQLSKVINAISHVYSFGISEYTAFIVSFYHYRHHVATWELSY